MRIVTRTRQGAPRRRDRLLVLYRCTRAPVHPYTLAFAAHPRWALPLVARGTVCCDTHQLPRPPPWPDAVSPCQLNRPPSQLGLRPYNHSSSHHNQSQRWVRLSKGVNKT